MGTLKGCKRNNMTVRENKWQWQREVEWEKRVIWKKYNKWNAKPSYLQPMIKLMPPWQALWNCAVVQSSFIITGALKPRNRTTNGVRFGQTHWPCSWYWPPRKSLFNRAMKHTPQKHDKVSNDSTESKIEEVGKRKVKKKPVSFRGRAAGRIWKSIWIRAKWKSGGKKWQKNKVYFFPAD